MPSAGRFSARTDPSRTISSTRSARSLKSRVKVSFVHSTPADPPPGRPSRMAKPTALSEFRSSPLFQTADPTTTPTRETRRSRGGTEAEPRRGQETAAAGSVGSSPRDRKGLRQISGPRRTAKLWAVRPFPMIRPRPVREGGPDPSAHCGRYRASERRGDDMESSPPGAPGHAQDIHVDPHPRPLWPMSRADRQTTAARHAVAALRRSDRMDSAST
jgi:hypothetical protein